MPNCKEKPSLTFPSPPPNTLILKNKNKKTLPNLARFVKRMLDRAKRIPIQISFEASQKQSVFQQKGS